MNLLLKWIFSILLTLISFVVFVKADLYTSLADLERLVQTEKDIPNLINDYISYENKRLEKLKR